MKKLYSLIKACMTSDMSLFKIKTKKNGKRSALLPLFIALYLMFVIWSSANVMFEKLAPMNLAPFLLALASFGISIMTIIEGIYKSGSLIFNAKDDDLLLSLPIKRSTVLFIRVFKFYTFELLFNSLFLLPIMVAYIRWGSNITWTYFLTSLLMLLLLPIIPIVISCIIGALTSSLSSRFKYKNAVEIIISMIFLIGILYFSFNVEGLFNYITENANSINDIITKIYYPAGIYAKLVADFKILDLLIFILVNIFIFLIFIYSLSKVYFKINSRLKKAVVSNKKVNVADLVIKSHSKTYSLIKKEINTFFKTPVFIINAGFALVLFILGSIIVSIRFDSALNLLTNMKEFNITKELIINNISILILILITLAAFMTSITNSVISLEGKSISILKSLPIKVKTILMSKVLAALTITAPVILLGDIILFIRFKITIIESILLIILSILMPLVSHFIGIIVNLKYPKLEWESTTEVVKQSTSSFIAVMIGMLLFIITVGIISSVIGSISSSIILVLATIIFMIIDLILYLYLINKGKQNFSDLN